MIRIIITCLCLIILATSTKLKAQIDTSTTQKLLQYIMQPIDKNQISTGFLEEYGCPLLPMATFNGTLTDSNRIDMNLWRTLYLQFQTGWAKNTANPLPAITSVNTNIKQMVSKSLPVPIPLLIGQYNTVSPDAFSNNLLIYNSGTNQIYDVTGRSQSPYDTKNLFAACPNKKYTLTGSETFIIPSALVWNNTSKTISQLQINFANGNGFQIVNIGSPFSVSYSDTGSKRWTIKATMNDNSILQCYSDYYVLKASNIGEQFDRNESVFPLWGFINAVDGQRGEAKVSINYSKNNYTGTLRKPLIVVEGYDVSFIAPSLQSDYDVDYFINYELPKANVPGWDFNSKLDNVAGYDLVFINFTDGAADIVLNAGAVQEVINRVNANKVLDNRFSNIRQQNVVMGMSMGGLCARYALANMTKNFPGSPTETRLLITHDSPHKGANVPLGIQYMIRMLGGVQLFGYNVYDIYPDYNDAIGLLNAPATKQLLLYRSATANTVENNTFLDAIYRPMITFTTTDPQPSYRFIATSLGNECARPLFTPGKTFINLGAGVSAGIDARFLFFRVPIISYKLAAEVESYALPTAGSTNKIARVYTINNLKLFGFINIFKQLYNNTAYAPGTHLAIDGVPGSNYPFLDVQALNQLTNLPVFAASLYVTFPLGPFLSGYFGAYAYNQGVSYNFTFVSTASALDASPYTTPVFSQKYVNGTNQNYPSTSDAFIAQETTTNAATTNNVHIRFTARNSRWLFNEMENLNNSESCSSECTNPFYISGNDAFCSSGSYVIPGFPRGGSITWNITPSNIVSTQINGSSITLTKIGNGTITLSANINACGQSGVISKTILVGAPLPPILLGLNYDRFCGTYVEAGCISAGATNYIWNLNYGQVDGEGDYFYQAPLVYNPMVGFTYFNYLSVQAQNTCGLSDESTVSLKVGPVPARCGGGIQLILAPNPTTGVLKIETSDNSEFSKIRITDKMGRVKKEFNYAVTRKVTLNVADLPADVYRIQVLINNKWTTVSFIKQ